MKILVPLDGSAFSEVVLGPATQMAEAMGAEIHLLTVVEEPKEHGIWARALTRIGEAEIGAEMSEIGMAQIPPLPDPRVAAEAREQALRSAEEYMAGIARRFSPGRVKVRVIHGEEPVNAIMAFSRDEGMDLIAMSTHGRSGLGRWVYGSVADKVLQSSPIPLLLLRPREKSEGVPLEMSPIDALVVPLDGSALAESALAYVEELARKMALKISLIQVVPQVGMTYPVGEHYTYDPRLDQDMENAAVGYLKQKMAEVQQKRLRVEYQVKRGIPAAAIIDFAEERGSSLIVMSTHGRSGIGRWLLGSVADRVLRASFSPVLLLRSQEPAA
ncbi:MAG: universal stress protein [Dehalococcoidia bacterium]|nr:universal stress protein [Dehalococcoidia bacterium]